MVDTRRFAAIPPAQAVIELIELLQSLENKYRDALAIVNAARRQRNKRQEFDCTGTQAVFVELCEAVEVTDCLLDTWRWTK